MDEHEKGFNWCISKAAEKGSEGGENKELALTGRASERLSSDIDPRERESSVALCQFAPLDRRAILVTCASRLTEDNLCQRTMAGQAKIKSRLEYAVT